MVHVQAFQTFVCIICKCLLAVFTIIAVSGLHRTLSTHLQFLLACSSMPCGWQFFLARQAYLGHLTTYAVHCRLVIIAVGGVYRTIKTHLQFHARVFFNALWLAVLLPIGSSSISWASHSNIGSVFSLVFLGSPCLCYQS